jgi:RNA polymerase primary sigma factor
MPDRWAVGNFWCRPVASTSGVPDISPLHGRRSLIDDAYKVSSVLLTAEEERHLARLMEQGREAEAQLAVRGLPAVERRRLRQAVADGRSARDRFIECNLRLVIRIARKFPVPPGMEFADLVQEGNVGLMQAVDRFDWRKGFKFSTYASWWIKQALTRSTSSANVIHIPEDVMVGVRSMMRGDGANNISDERMAAAAAVLDVDSLDRPVQSENDQTLGDTVTDEALSPERLLENEWSNEVVRQVLSLLDHRTARLVLSERVRLSDPSVAEIAAGLGVSQWAVRRHLSAALEQLRESSEAHRLLGPVQTEVVA